MDKTKPFQMSTIKKYVCSLYLLPYIHWYLFLKFYAVLYDTLLYIVSFYDSTEQKREIDFILHVGLRSIEGIENTR